MDKETKQIIKRLPQNMREEIAEYMRNIHAFSMEVISKTGKTYNPRTILKLWKLKKLLKNRNFIYYAIVADELNCSFSTARRIMKLFAEIDEKWIYKRGRLERRSENEGS